MNDENTKHEHRPRTIANMSKNAKNDWKELRIMSSELVSRANNWF
jgi:hypothetical protein